MMETFSQTSDQPYNRHNYKLYYTTGKTIVFDNYEDVQLTWFQTSPDFLSHVEVLDKEKPLKSKGFKSP